VAVGQRGLGKADALLRGDLVGDGWAHLAVTSVVWLVVPTVVAVINLLRSEVK
jgi:hypothetical protein